MMNRAMILAVVLLSGSVSFPMEVVAAAESAASAQAAYGLRTKMAVLMDNPATMAILVKHMPDVMAEPDISKSRGYSLKFIANFDKRIRAALPAIERDLAAVH